jgi:nitroreductase
MTQAEIIQAFEHVVRSRHSVRGFLTQSVDTQKLQQIFTLAQSAPSNCNTQPWSVHVASGAKNGILKHELTEAIMRGEFSMDFPYEGKYENEFRERQYDAANQLYTAMGIAREDKLSRNAAFLRNFSFFDAPHVVFLFMHEKFGIREAIDVGMYAQNLMLSMTAHGVASCPQTALGFHADKVREVLGIPKELKLLFGISFGYEDDSVPANKARVGRASLDSTVTFYE